MVTRFDLFGVAQPQPRVAGNRCAVELRITGSLGR
jgi:hypothetical protein